MIASPNEIDKFGVSASDTYTISPFTTRVNNPSVSRMAGKASIVTIGFSTEFTIENINPAATKVPAIAVVSGAT